MKISEVFRPPIKGAVTGETLSIDGNTVELHIDMHDARAGYHLVYVDSDVFDTAFSKSANFYVGKYGENGIGKRYNQFGDWIKQSPSMIVSSVDVNKDGVVMFANGRHRYSYLRDNGINPIPVAMDNESIENAKKFNYITGLNEIYVGGSRDEFIEKYASLFNHTIKKFAFKTPEESFDYAYVTNDDNHYVGLFVDDSLISLLIVDDYRNGKMQVQLTSTERMYRGIGCFRYLLNLAIKKFGEILSDDTQTTEASMAWKALIARPEGLLKFSVYDPNTNEYSPLDKFEDASGIKVISVTRNSSRLDEMDHPRNIWAKAKNIDRDYMSLTYGTRSTYFNP